MLLYPFPLLPPPLPMLSLQEHDVRHMLRSVNPRKAAGPDGVLVKELRCKPAHGGLHQDLQLTGPHPILLEICYYNPTP